MNQVLKDGSTVIRSCQQAASRPETSQFDFPGEDTAETERITSLSLTNPINAKRRKTALDQDVTVSI